ncbi:hypothetical protein [Reichenbachiella sp.]
MRKISEAIREGISACLVRMNNPIRPTSKGEYHKMFSFFMISERSERKIESDRRNLQAHWHLQNMSLTQINQRICGIREEPRISQIYIGARVFPTDTNAFRSDTNTFIHDADAFPSDTNAFFCDTDTFLSDTNAFLYDTNAFSSDTNPFFRDTDGFYNEANTLISDAKAFSHITKVGHHDNNIFTHWHLSINFLTIKINTMSKSIEQLLSDSNTAIHNAIDNTEVNQAIGLFGYTAEKLQAGKALLDQTQTLYTRQVQEYGDKSEASQHMTEARDQLNASYMPHLKIARIAFKNDMGAFQALELQGTRKRTNASALAQAKVFYTNLLAKESYKTAMAAFGIDEAKMTEALGMIEKAEEALAVFKKESGEAQEATDQRDKATGELEEWISDFKAIAKIALEDQPQMMEVLGIVSR